MQRIGSFFRDLVTPLLVLLMGGVIAYDHFVTRDPADRPSLVDGKALGRSYAPLAASTLAEGWSAAADAIDQGKSVAEAQAVLQATWKEARVKAFAAKVSPGMGVVLPEGTEPNDPVKRAEVAKLWRDFAAGLKGGR